MICDEIAILGILSAGGVQSVIREIEHAPERNRVFGRVKRRKDKVVCRQLVGDGGWSHGCLTHSDVLACGDNRAFFCQTAAHRAVFVAGVSVHVKSGCDGVFQLALGVVRGFVATEGASRIFAGIPVRMLVVLPHGGVKIVLGDDKPDRCGCFNARAAVPGIFRCSAKLYRCDIIPCRQIAFGFYPPIRHRATGINRRWNAIESQRKIIACIFAFERDGRTVSPNFSRSRVFDCDGNGVLCAVPHSHRAEINGINACTVGGCGNRADIYGDGLGVPAFVRHFDGDFRGFTYASGVWRDVYFVQIGFV